MTKLLKPLLAAASLAVAAPAFAQAGGVAVADLDAAVGNVAALKAAATQYKPQLDAFNARRQAAAQELAPLQQEIEALQRNASTPPATLQAKVTAFRARETALQQQLQPLAAPFQRPLAYAQAQVQEKLEGAVRAAMAAKRIGIIINPQSTQIALPTNDLTADITAQLNTLVKTVSTTPPAGWQPGQPTGTAAAAGR